MKRTSRIILLFCSVLIVVIMPSACAKKSYINIEYRLPVVSDDLNDRSVFLDCQDARASKSIFSKKAEAQFKHFTGLFSLSVQEGKKPFVAGAYDLTSLFEEAFSRRLRQMGIAVITQQDKTTPVIEIIIKKFRLDLVDRNWVADIAYDARLLKDNTLLRTETISGDAQRVKVLGRGDAEKVLGEIFTDIVNQLDIRKLLDHAAS
jgi:hypothetical protein